VVSLSGSSDFSLDRDDRATIGRASESPRQASINFGIGASAETGPAN